MTIALGISDEITTCDCCGKSGLKSTVIMRLDSGEVVHYGSVCAKRNTGKTQPIINNEIKDEYARRLNAAREEWKSHPAHRAYEARLVQRTREGIAVGRASMDFVKDTADNADIAAKVLAMKFGINVYKIRT